MLTRKQQELLRFIEARLDADGVSPSFEEMKAALDLKSKSGIHRLITALEERGFIRRLPHRARALEVVKRADLAPIRPPAPPGAPPPVRAGFTPNDPRKFSDPIGAPRRPPPAATGRPAALRPDRRRDPIEALRGQRTCRSAGDNGHRRRALRAFGGRRLMVEAGIHDGDTVIIQRCDNAENGSIVVALVDEAEVTLKAAARRGGRAGARQRGL